MTLSELTKEDYLRLKGHFVLLVVCLVVVIAAFVVSSQLQNEANRQLNIARSDMTSAQMRLEQAEQEGATLDVYRERYAQIDSSGIARPGDRLVMQEHFAQIRSRFNLFPIQLQIGGQNDYVLPYDAAIAEPGAPVSLLISEITATLPLLHEDDLSNLLAALEDENELVLTQSCDVQVNSRNAREFLQLGPHMNANCSFLWYTFRIQEAMQ